MKKTLLSIVTMAILASSSVYAQPLNKDIRVEAEVHSNVSLAKADGSELNNIKLSYDANRNDGTHTYNEHIIIKASGAKRVKVALLDDFSLENGTSDKFTDHSVSIGGKRIQSPIKAIGVVAPINQFFDLVNDEVTLELIMSAKQPQGAAVGIYSAVATLVIEEVI